MSFGGGSGRSSFGKKGFSGGQKKEKKKKQEFHKHKVKFSEEEHVDFQNLKERTVASLGKLGSQIFSLEPGGYTFDNWMTSFNMLLDDFEERAEPANLPQNYFENRQRLTSSLLEPIDTSDLDGEINETNKQIFELETSLSQIIEESASERSKAHEEDLVRLRSLKEEQVKNSEELVIARNELEQKKMEKQSVFNKLFKRSEPSVESIQRKVNDLETKSAKLETDIRKLQDDVGATSQFHESTRSSNERAKIEELRSMLGELEARKLETTQLSEKRAHVTKELSEIVSSISLGEPLTET